MKSHCLLLSLAAIAASPAAEEMKFPPMPPVGGEVMEVHADELYHGQRGPVENMHILAAAFSFKESGGTGMSEPMVWRIRYGKGKVITLVPGNLGENPKYPTAYDCIGFRTILQRPAKWVATEEVTLPVSVDFPTAERISEVLERTSR